MNTRVIKYRGHTIEIVPRNEPNITPSEYWEKLKFYKTKLSNYQRGTPEWEIYVSKITNLRVRHSGYDLYEQKQYLALTFKITLNHWSKSTQKFSVEIKKSLFMDREIRQYVLHYCKRALQTVRNITKFKSKTGLFGKDAYEFSGGPELGRTFIVPGQVLKSYVKKNMSKLYEVKKPTTNSNYIGIEIEFCARITEEQLAHKLFQAGTHKFLELKKDGSLRPKDGENGFELAMLFRESSYKKDLKQVIGILTQIKATATDRRCGLHVHFDMRKRTKEVVYNNLVSCENALWSIVDPRRYDTEFCRIVRNKKFPTQFDGSREERYKTINAASYFRHKTLEVRMHEGSVDFKSISNWVDVLIKIVNYKKKIKQNISKLPALKDKFKISSKVYQAILDKSCSWQVNFSQDVRRFQQSNDVIFTTQREINSGAALTLNELQRNLNLTVLNEIDENNEEQSNV